MKLDAADLENALRRLKGAAPVAVARALNRSIATVRTQAVRAVAQDVGLPQKSVREAMPIQQATPGRLVARLEVTGKKIPLYDFKARQTARGVTYRLPGGRNFLPSGFIATMKSGHVGVFVRGLGAKHQKGRGSWRQRSGWPALPIKERFGPSLPRVFGRQRITDALRTVAKDVMAKNLAHEVQFLLQQRGAA